MRTLCAEVPDKLHARALALVREGWFKSAADLVVEAVRRYVEAHEPALMERFIREDVEWGLHGDD